MSSTSNELKDKKRDTVLLGKGFYCGLSHRISNSKMMMMKKKIEDSSSDDDGASPIDMGAFQMKSKKQIRKTVKDLNIRSIHNDMTKLMNTEPNSTEDLMTLGGEGVITHKIHLDEKRGKKMPTYIHKSVTQCRQINPKMVDRHGKKIKSTDGLFGCPLVMSHYSSNEFAALKQFIDRQPIEVHKQLNCFSKYLDESCLFVIDCDSKAAMDRCAKMDLLKGCPRTTSFSGKHHYYARRKEDERKVAQKCLAKNFFLPQAREEFPGEANAIDLFMEKHPERNIDILYNGNLFEMRYDDDGLPRVVDNWDGKLESIPTISIGQIQKEFGMRIQKHGTKEANRIADENSAIEKAKCVELKQENWTGACFEVPAEAEVVEHLLEAVPNDYLANYAGWNKVRLIMCGQETKEKKFITQFNRKMERVFNSVCGKDKKYMGKTFLCWKNENIKLFKNYKKPAPGEPCLTIRSLWHIVFESDRKAWAKIKSKQGGLPSHKVMSEMKYYKDQKEYFEKFGYYVIGETEPVICVRNFGLKKSIVMKKSQFAQQVWEKVSSWDIVPMEKDGEPVLDQNGQPKMKDRFLGKFPKVWLDDVYGKVYEQEVFLPDGWEHATDKFADQGASEMNVNTWKGLHIKNLIESKDACIMVSVDKQMKKDEEEHGDKWYSIRRIRELCWYLCGQEKKTFDYVEIWVSFNLKYPGLLTNTILLFSSVAGCGKNLFWDWIGKLCGSDYYLSSSSPQAFFEKHTVAIENKVLALVNEMNYKIMKTNQEVIKGRATEAEIYFNPKNLPAREARNCCNMVMAMNATNPPVEANQRRYCLIRSARSHKYKEGYFRDVAADMESQVIQVIYYKYMCEKIDAPPAYPFERNIPKTEFQKTRAEQGMDVAIKFGKYLMIQWNKANETRQKKCECSAFGYNSNTVKCTCIFGIIGGKSKTGYDDVELTKTYQLWKRWSADLGELGGGDSNKNHGSFKAVIRSHTRGVLENKAHLEIWKKEEDKFCQFFLTTRKAGQDGKKIHKVHFDVNRFAHFYAWNQQKETGDPYDQHIGIINSIGTESFVVKQQGMENFITDVEVDGASEDEEDDW